MFGHETMRTLMYSINSLLLNKIYRTLNKFLHQLSSGNESQLFESPTGFTHETDNLDQLFKVTNISTHDLIFEDILGKSSMTIILNMLLPSDLYNHTITESH